MSLARRTDPKTSHEAAERLIGAGRHRSQKEAVYAALVANPGVTSKELSLITLIDRYVIARRLPDLRDDGLAYTDGRGPDGVYWFPMPEQLRISDDA